MIGTACFYILPVVGDRTFFKDQELLKKITAFLKRTRAFLKTS